MARLRIGFGIDFLGSSYHKAIHRGVEAACAQAGVDLVCAVTGRYGSSLESERCRNVLLDFLAGGAFDGIVLAGASIGNLAEPAAMDALLAQLGRKPLALMGACAGDHGLIRASSGGDLGPLVRHLIRGHGYRRLAYLGGTPSNQDALHRRGSFLAACLAEGLEPDPALLFEGDFRPEAGRRTIETLLAASRGPLPEALVCANDAMAWGAIDGLREHGLAAGRDIAVTGYDDIPISEAIGLSSMRQDLETEAWETCLQLVAALRSEPYQATIRVPERLVLRQSCGCRPEPAPLNPEPGLASREPEFRHASYRELRMEELNDRAERIASCFERGRLAEVLRSTLFEMNIPRFFVAVHQDGAKPTAGSDIVASGGLPDLPSSLGPDCALPEEAFADGERRSWLLHALFHGFEHLGLIAFAPGARELDFYEQLRIRISLSLKGSSLVGALQDYASQLEQKVAERTRLLNQELEMRRQTELSLRSSEQQIRELATKVPGIVMELDGRLNISFINQTGMEVLGCRAPGPGQAPIAFLELLSPETRAGVRDFLRAVLARVDNQTQQTELRVLSGQRGPIVLLVNVGARGQRGPGRGLYLSALDLNPLLDSAVSPDAVFHAHYHLSPRVREVFELLIRGLSTEEVAAELGIAANTVKVHIHSIYIATGTKNRRELFALLKEYQQRSFGYGSFLHSLLAGVINSGKGTEAAGRRN